MAGEGNSTDKEYRILSIQSHVVSGYVGNRSAVFPLQVLGFDVDFIDTVQLSNHTGYPVVMGNALDEKGLEELFDGLVKNRIALRYTHVLTGFVRSKSLLLAVADVVRRLKVINPSLIYVCDPVMGDLGKMYVHADVLEAYREHIVPLADILTPNQFEIELLTGTVINSEESAFAAIDLLHKQKVPNVIISSSELGDDGVLMGFGSCLKSAGLRSKFRIKIPRFPAAFTGTGDLFTSLILAWNTRSGGDMMKACEHAVSTLQAVLKRTLSHYEQYKEETDLAVLMQALELRLIQSKADIENPKLCVKCEPIP